MMIEAATEKTRKEFRLKVNKKYVSKCLPMLKWAGGKRRLIKHLIPIMNQYKFIKYYEPFFGGGALFFATQPENSILSDTNEELINCYLYVRDYPDLVIRQLRNMPNTEEDYYRIRSEKPTDDLVRAARVIYLTTLSFNGIYRLNQKGEFNVPYGHKVHLDPCDEDRIMSVSKALKNAQIRCSDFEDVVEDAKQGDLIYFDPPYTIIQGNGFIKYNSNVFTWDDQIRLAKTAKRLVQRGCNVIISNADAPEIIELYEDFNFIRLERPSVIAASGEHRKKVTESIFFSEV